MLYALLGLLAGFLIGPLRAYLFSSLQVPSNCWRAAGDLGVLRR